MFTIAFVSVLIGADAMKTFVESIPSAILDGMKIAFGLLPAVGFALLLKVMYSKKVAVFYFLGFLLAAYANLPIMAVAISGVILAVIIEFVVGNKDVVANNNNVDDGEALFDD